MMSLKTIGHVSTSMAAELSLLVALLLGSLSANAQPVSSTKPTCRPSCGNLTVIPFPFGIGDKGCFLNEWYEIVCEQNKTVPRLKKIDLEVRSITLPDYSETEPLQATIQVSLPVVHSTESCSRDNRTRRGPPSLAGSPFVYSVRENILLSVGCNYLTVVNQAGSVLAGCYSTCGGQGSSRSFSYCEGEEGCCSSGISQLVLQEFSIEMVKEGSETAARDQECSYTFIVDKSQSYSTVSNSLYLQGFVIGVLEWGIPSDIDLETELPSSCRNCQKVYGDTFPDSIDRFSCRKGYTGNPYIKDGCMDIDECEDKSICPDLCVNTDGGFQCRSSRSTLTFVVVGLGAGLWLLVCIPLLLWSYRTVKGTKQRMRKEMLFKRNGGTVLQQQLSSYEGSAETSKLFSFKELEKATDSFNEDRILGKGGQGTVYKGMLSDGRIVAVKKFAVEEGKVRQFINEVLVLSQINHRNVVKLLGCCLETEVPFLVYEFIPNGTLYSYLHEPNGGFFIPCEVRLRLATEVAEALSYMHSAASVPIYHRDIKSTNILLDEKYRAKLADFGSSRYVSLDRTHVTTLVQGTFGYLDPEYFQSSQLTDKRDVYSFGVVLVELMTGQKPISSVRAQEGIGLATYFTIMMEENRLFDILDHHILQQAEKDQIMAVADLAKKCLHLNGRKRPTMKEVASVLEGIRKPLAPIGNVHLCHELSTCLSIDRTSEASQNYADVPTSTFSEVLVNVASMSDVDPLLCAQTW